MGLQRVRHDLVTEQHAQRGVCVCVCVCVCIYPILYLALIYKLEILCLLPTLQTLRFCLFIYCFCSTFSLFLWVSIYYIDSPCPIRFIFFYVSFPLFWLSVFQSGFFFWPSFQCTNYLFQFSPVVSDSLWPPEPQHARPPCPSPTPGVHPNPCPSSQCCHPPISSSVLPFSSCPQSFPASGSFQMSQLFASGDDKI